MKRLGIIRQGYSQPLFHVLRSRAASASGAAAPVEVIENTPAILAQKLHQHELDAAFLSPIEYALHAEELRIIPEVALISAGESRATQLLFKERLSKIKTIAVNAQVSASDIVLANIVLAEKYELTPQIVPVSSSPKDSLLKNDAALISGDDVFQIVDSHRLDVVDEWSDLTDLPYVHGIWVAPKNGLSAPEVEMIIQMTNEGVTAFAYEGAQQKWYEEHFGYRLHEDAAYALTEFLSMAYYHGILKDIVTPAFFQSISASRN